MSRLPQASLFTVALLLGVAFSASGETTPAWLAGNRCNSLTVDGASERIRDYDRHPPPDAPAALLARYGAIADVISTLNEERGILNTVCSNEVQKAPLFAQIAEFSAWALALEADVAARLNATCPAAARAFPRMMLADAWLTLANVVNHDDGTVPATFGEVVPRLETRAQAVGLTFPAWAQTSQYWRDQLHAREKAEIAACPSPSPRSSP